MEKEAGQFSLWERPNQRAWQERAELRPGGGPRGVVREGPGSFSRADRRQHLPVVRRLLHDQTTLALHFGHQGGWNVGHEPDEEAHEHHVLGAWGSQRDSESLSYLHLSTLAEC